MGCDVGVLVVSGRCWSLLVVVGRGRRGRRAVVVAASTGGAVAFAAVVDRDMAKAALLCGAQSNRARLLRECLCWSDVGHAIFAKVTFNRPRLLASF